VDKFLKVGEYSNGWSREGILRVEVDMGYRLPWGYGLSYYRYDCAKGVCYPLIINWIVWALREIYLIFLSAPNRGIERKSYELGIKEGRKMAEDGLYFRHVTAEQERIRKAYYLEIKK